MALQLVQWDDSKNSFKRGGSSPDFRAGRQDVSSGQTSVSVTFSSALPNTNYMVTATWHNVDDSAPQVQSFIVTAFSTTGFTLTWPAPTDTANYKINWHVIAFS